MNLLPDAKLSAFMTIGKFVVSKNFLDFSLFLKIPNFAVGILIFGKVV